MRHVKIVSLLIVSVLLLIPVAYGGYHSVFTSSGNQLTVIASSGTVSYDAGNGGLMDTPAFVQSNGRYAVSAGTHVLTEGHPTVEYTSGRTDTTQVTYEVQINLSPQSAINGCRVNVTVDGHTENLGLTYGIGFKGGLGPISLDANRHTSIPVSLSIVYSSGVTVDTQPTLSFLLRIYDGGHVTEFLFGPQAV